MTDQPARRATPHTAGETRSRRLSQDDRRRQLIGIGLQMLASRPIHALSVDAVAAEAGISRGLLFHYFPTKQHYYTAVVRAAARRLLNAAQADPEVAAAEQLRSIVAAFVGFIDRHLEPYTAFFRGGAGADPDIREIFEDIRDTLTERALAALRVPATPTSRMTVRAWWSLVESLAVDRAEQRVTTPDALVRYAAATLTDLLTRARDLPVGDGAATTR
ncbi:TetR/AcrR family transcriptional regulator [Planosporangium sp. 12N6]|uniref:TetR/AcrR family transcriptional regulator n=1 Tax=Planosporangium spinosum TaxID=3402278 RepID=UPI003CED77D2